MTQFLNVRLNRIRSNDAGNRFAVPLLVARDFADAVAGNVLADDPLGLWQWDPAWRLFGRLWLVLAGFASFSLIFRIPFYTSTTGKFGAHLDAAPRIAFDSSAASLSFWAFLFQTTSPENSLSFEAPLSNAAIFVLTLVGHTSMEVSTCMARTSRILLFLQSDPLGRASSATGGQSRILLSQVCTAQKVFEARVAAQRIKGWLNQIVLKG